jgi:hypothetical protein
VCIALICTAIYFLIPFIKYQVAGMQVENGKYDSAYKIYLSLGDYKDSSEKAYLAATEMLEDIDGYSNSHTLLLKAKYKYIKSYMDKPTDQTRRYLRELMAEGYKDTESIYKKLYG